mgnify:CR=1 FL=1
MPIYNVIRKSDGQQVYEYNSDAPIEWSGMEFATHDHIEHVEINEDGSIEGTVTGRVMTKLEYLRRFTQDERVAIRAAAKSNAVLEDYMALLELAQDVDTTDADTVAAVNMLEQVGLIAAGRAQEILNG